MSVRTFINISTVFGKNLLNFYVKVCMTSCHIVSSVEDVSEDLLKMTAFYQFICLILNFDKNDNNFPVF